MKRILTGQPQLDNKWLLPLGVHMLPQLSYTMAWSLLYSTSADSVLSGIPTTGHAGVCQYNRTWSGTLGKMTSTKLCKAFSATKPFKVQNCPALFFYSLQLTTFPLGSRSPTQQMTSYSTSIISTPSPRALKFPSWSCNMQMTMPSSPTQRRMRI